MFRQEEIIIGGWREKTPEALQQRRFEAQLRQLPPLGEGRLQALSAAQLTDRLEQSWQIISRKPSRTLQLAEIRRVVTGSAAVHAACLSQDEHELVERALILGGTARLMDCAELEAARALSLRLWANVGLASGKPMMELTPEIMRPAAKAFASQAHERIRRRFADFHAYMMSVLYRLGAVDDGIPQQLVAREIIGSDVGEEERLMLARRYLWASFDCVDYADGVLLLHPALAEPIGMGGGRKPLLILPTQPLCMLGDILPEEIPLQRAMERALSGAVRRGINAQDVARTLRYLCKQGAPLSALRDVLAGTLIVRVTPEMERALVDLHAMTPKWVRAEDALQ